MSYSPDPVWFSAENMYLTSWQMLYNIIKTWLWYDYKVLPPLCSAAELHIQMQVKVPYWATGKLATKHRVWNKTTPEGQAGEEKVKQRTWKGAACQQPVKSSVRKNKP